MKKRLLCILLALVLILVPLPVSAAQGAAVRCGSGQGQPGDYLYFPITAEDLSAVAAMELALFYDPEVLEFVTCDNGWLLGDALVSSHDAGGSLTLTAISAEGISGSGELFYLGFLIRQDCAPGKYPLTLTAGEVYDTALSPVSLSARGGSVTVTEYAPVYSEFYLEMGLSDDTIAPGETVTAHVRNGWYMAFASCDLSVHYDATMFRLVDARVSGEIAGTVHSLNTDTPGLVRLSCATAENIWCYDLLELTLEAKADAIGTTALTAEIRDVYDAGRIPYRPGSAQAELTVVPSQSVRPPRLRLEGDAPVIGEETVTTLTLDEGSGLAAADFELRYDPRLLECLAVEPAADAQFLLINPNFADGTIRFSFVEEAGVTEEISLVNIRWKARNGADRHYAVEMQLIDPVDADFRPVAIDCATQMGCIYLREVTAPTCEAPGGEQLRCVSCGDLIPVSPLPPLGHDYGDAEFHWSDDYTACTATRVCARDEGHVWQVSCTVTHVSEGESCTQPGSVTYTATADFYGERFTDSRTVHKDMLGHDYAWTVLTEPGCTAEGLRRGECRRCGDTTRETVAPLGHDYHAQVTAPGCTEGGWTDHICNRCGDRVRDSFTDPVGHDWEGSSCSRCGAPRENPFTDVPEGSFFYDPVLWAVKNGVTSGATPTTFDPNGSCMRAHVVTFLWRAVGQPEPSSTDNPFVDVKPSHFYYKAVLWAVQNGVTAGLDSTHFGPNVICNRAQVVTFLYRTLGQPPVSSDSSPFTDVSKGVWYEKPILWAVENGITAGLTPTTFGPNAICNRAQVVTFLYRTFS